MDPVMIQHLARARLADLHRQARREAMARAVRQSRRARRQLTGYHRSGLLRALNWRGSRSCAGGRSLGARGIG